MRGNGPSNQQKEALVMAMTRQAQKRFAIAAVAAAPAMTRIRKGS